jgi:hypothetical protein
MRSDMEVTLCQVTTDNTSSYLTTPASWWPVLKRVT